MKKWKNERKEREKERTSNEWKNFLWYELLNYFLDYKGANPGGRELPGIAGSNPAWRMNVCVLW